MKEKQLFETIGEIDSVFIDEAENKKKNKIHRLPLKRIIASAACLLLIVGVGAFTLGRGQRLELKASSGVTARVVKKAPQESSNYDLIFLTEEELFTHFNTAIFEGTVTKTDNIKLEFASDRRSTVYWSLATIRVSKVFRGDIADNSEVTVLLPCPIGEEIQVEDTEIVSQMRVGTKGIFMPVVYDEKSTYETSGSKLCLLDLAPYGFADGVRYAFLETENGLLKEEWAYPSLENAKTLDDVAAFIEKMIA